MRLNGDKNARRISVVTILGSIVVVQWSLLFAHAFYSAYSSVFSLTPPANGSQDEWLWLTLRAGQVAGMLGVLTWPAIGILGGIQYIRRKRIGIVAIAVASLFFVVVALFIISIVRVADPAVEFSALLRAIRLPLLFGLPSWAALMLGLKWYALFAPPRTGQ